MNGREICKIDIAELDEDGQCRPVRFICYSKIY